MEVLGGNGYTEELPLARMVREMPVNSIWEGSGNIMCLDVLRALRSTPSRDALLQELSPARGKHRCFDAAFERLSLAMDASLDEAHARRFTQLLVTLMQAGLLIGAAKDGETNSVAEGFCSTRLCADSGWGAVFGASDARLDTAAILRRAWERD
jgi:putative acyl-CoA dehydrogenase